MVRQRENDAWNLVIFAYITANMAVTSNTCDNRTLTMQNLASALCSQPLDATKNVAINYKIKLK